MAFKYGNRAQTTLFPSSFEDYVKSCDPVRAYDAFIDCLDFDKLGITLADGKAGNPSYDPISMVKLLVFGYSYGILSGRKLERAVHHNVCFMWLMGGLKPCFRTINRFRRNNETALKQILRHCARLCLQLDLVEGNILFVDGSKVKANASIDNKWDTTRCERVLKKVENRIDELMEQCNAIEETEDHKESLVSMHEELSDKKVLLEKVQQIAEAIEQEPPVQKGKSVPSINTVDSDSKPMHTKKGSFSGYNVQSVTDGKHGLVVSVDVVQDRNDLQQLSYQIKNAEDNLEKPCTTVVADTGYHSSDPMITLHEENKTVIVAPKKEELKDAVESKKLKKHHFIYDSDSNTYTCPGGHILGYSCSDTVKKEYVYKILNPSTCISCKYREKCTSSQKGRMIIRSFDEEQRDTLRDIYNSESSQEIYSKRKEFAERPFGYTKHNMNFQQFLLRGIKGAAAEMSLLLTGFNIKRMITLLGGVENTIKSLNACN